MGAKIKNHKEKILDTALKLFAKRGYSNTPVSLIASTAGVSQGLMYNYFKGKEALLTALMERGFEDIKDSMESYQTTKEPCQAIGQHIRKTIKLVQAHSAFWRLLHAIRLQGKVTEKAKPIFQQIITSVTTTFTDVFQQLGYENPHLEAMLFLSQIDGLVILYLQDEKHVPIARLGEQLIKRYTR